MKNGKKSNPKILLVLLPFWTPLIPPLGISSLKQFLQAHGYDVRAVDINIDDRFKEVNIVYFNTLKNIVPANQWGNIYNVGKDVLQNHMMAHQNFKEPDAYKELVKILVRKTFFCEIDDELILRLTGIIETFYAALEDYFVDLLERERPGVLGFSVYEGTLPASLFAAGLARERYPHIKIVMGGGIYAEQLSAGSPNWDYFLERTAFIDAFIVGEGENLFLKYLRNELPEAQRVYTLDTIAGETVDLSRAGIPDFSDFHLENYPYMAVFTSRSCPFQCNFCSETVQWGKYRKKGAAQVVEELRILHQRCGSQLFLMCDSLLNPMVTELAAEIKKSGLAIYWDGYLRAGKEVCDTENTLSWRRGGYYRARLGLESGSPRVLRWMNKKINVDQMKQSLISLAYAGIKTTTYWVIGYPGETDEDFRQTLEFIEEMRNYIYEAWCSPFYYYPAGQVNSQEWRERRSLLYPESAKEMLILRTWVQDCEPSREETYGRMWRFVRRCRELGVPNPYTLNDFCRADERWKTLQPNAVPPLVEFGDNTARIDDMKDVDTFLPARKSQSHDGDFGF